MHRIVTFLAVIFPIWLKWAVHRFYGCTGRAKKCNLILYSCPWKEKSIVILHINLTNRQKLTRMDANKLLEDLTWANLLIIQGELKAIREFQVKELKHRDLWAVCSRLKIREVKNASKEAMLHKIVSIYIVPRKICLDIACLTFWRHFNLQ